MSFKSWSGGSLECLLQVKNNNSETIEVQLNNITFWSEVKYEEADINYVRFQWVEGTFYLNAFKEVPPHSSRSIPIDLGRVDDEFASHFGLSDNHRLLSSTVQGDVNPNTIYQVAYWDTEYHLTLRLDVFDKNGNVLLKDKALTASTTLFYQGSTQAKIDRDMRIQRLKEFGENAIKIIVLIVTISYSKDKLWEFVKGFWGDAGWVTSRLNYFFPSPFYYYYGELLLIFTIGISIFLLLFKCCCSCSGVWKCGGCLRQETCLFQCF